MGFRLTPYNLVDDAIQNVPGSISKISCPLTRDQEQQAARSTMHNVSIVIIRRRACPGVVQVDFSTELSTSYAGMLSIPRRLVVKYCTVSITVQY